MQAATDCSRNSAHSICHHYYFLISEYWLPCYRSELLKMWFLTPDTSVNPLSSLQAPKSSQSNKLCSYTEGENLKLGTSSLTFTHTTNFITFSGIICKGTELTMLVRCASLGSKFYTEVSVTLSKTSDYCRFAFSVRALGKGKQTQGILEESHNRSILQTSVRFVIACSKLLDVNVSVVSASTSGLKQVFVWQ